MPTYKVQVPTVTWDNYWVEANSAEEAFKKVHSENMNDGEWDSVESSCEGLEWAKPEQYPWFVNKNHETDLEEFNKSPEDWNPEKNTLPKSE